MVVVLVDNILQVMAPETMAVLGHLAVILDQAKTMEVPALEVMKEDKPMMEVLVATQMETLEEMEAQQTTI